MTIAQPHERTDVDPLTRDAEAEEAIAFLRALVAAQPAGEAAVQALAPSVAAPVAPPCSIAAWKKVLVCSTA